MDFWEILNAAFFSVPQLVLDIHSFICLSFNLLSYWHKTLQH